MYYLRLYENMAERNEDQTYRAMQKYYVGYTPPENQLVEYNMTEEEKVILYNMPLTFEILSDGNIYWKITGSTSNAKTIQYSKDNGTTWTSITATTGGASISVNTGDIVQFKGNNTRYGNSTTNYNSFSGTTCQFKAYGNIMSLINGTNFSGLTTLTQTYQFAWLFKNCTGMTQAPLLPAITLSNYCYYAMFYGCTSLAQTPELPATTLAQYCYCSMFQDCISLTKTPKLPATTLVNGCYNCMFYRCSGIKTTAKILPIMDLAYECYYGMYLGCSSLTEAPELPATTLSDRCYYAMFSGCTSLTTAPELPAATLTPSCYAYMFQGCSKLNYIKCLATNITASTCTINWVSRVAASGTFVKAASTTWSTGISGIPSGWVSWNDGISFLSGNKKYISLTGGTSDILLSSLSKWTATTTDNWITLGTSTGEKGNNITISITVSPTTTQRNGKITFTDSEGNSAIYSITQTDLTNQPLTFEIQSDGNINWFATTSYVVTLEYSKNGGEWTEITSTTGNGTNLSVVSGDTVQFRGNSPLNDGTTFGNCNYFRNTCSYSIVGNIMSLLNKTNFGTMTDLSSYDYAFYDLFYSNTGLTDASNLILPAMTLSSDLTYGNMFYNCTNLVTAPTLPATTLTPRCYWHMFRLSSKLNYIKCLAVDKSASNCVLDWVDGVASSGTFIKNPTMTGWSRGTSGIPTNWTIQDAT